MPQTYGVISDSNLAHNEPELNGEAHITSPLLGNASRDPSHDWKMTSDGTAGISSSVGNLANTILGTGVLAFPVAMASVGLIPGIISCCFSGSAAAFGLYLLSCCAALTPPRRSSFFAVSKLTFPSAAVFFDAAIAIKCFGVSISYLIIIKGLMPSVIVSLNHVISPDSALPAWSISGRFWISAFMTVLIPLCFLRRLDSLRHTSYVALFSVAYLVVIVIVSYFRPPKGSAEPGAIHLIKFSSSFVSTFPIQVFAFTCAQNLFPIYNELASNTQRRMNIVIGTSIGSATLTYEVISIFGYLTFGSKVGANIIAMYPNTTLFIALGQLAIVVLVLFSYPLQVHPCRNCLDKVFSASLITPKNKPSVVSAADDEDEDEELDASGHTIITDITPLKHTLLTAVIIIFGFTIAYFVDDLQLVLSFVGSTGSTTISFILPGLFYYKLFKDKDGHSASLKWAALALSLYGAFIFVFCLSFNIWNVVKGGRTGGD